jgi:hypothetical protein
MSNIKRGVPGYIEIAKDEFVSTQKATKEQLLAAAKEYRRIASVALEDAAALEAVVSGVIKLAPVNLPAHPGRAAA